MSWDQRAEQLERQRVRHVLRIVDDEHRERDGRLPLEIQDRLVDPVQAVRLAGRPVVRADDPVNIGERLRHDVDLPVGGRIVRVRADEDVVVRVRDGLQDVADHPTDHGRLVPGRHHHGDRLLGDAEQLLLGGDVRSRDPPVGHRDEAEVDEAVIDPAQQARDAHDGQQALADDEKDGENLGGAHRTASETGLNSRPRCSNGRRPLNHRVSASTILPAARPSPYGLIPVDISW